MKIGELDGPADAAHVPGRLDRMMAGETIIFEVTHRRKDGSEFPVEVSARVVEFEGRKCILAFDRDITARRRAQAALHESETRWQFALKAADDGVWDWNMETGEVFYSARWKSMLGYAESELGGTEAVWESLVHPEDLPGALATVTAHIDGTLEASLIEHRMKCKDGGWKWIRARGKVVDWIAPGRPRRMIGTHTDIDREKRRDEEQRSLTQRLDLAVQAGQFGTFQRDLLTGKADWDERSFEIFGFAPRPGGPMLPEIMEAILPEDHAVLTESLAAERSGQKYSTIEFRVRWPSGEVRVIIRRVRVQVGPEGLGVTATGLLEDVTALRLAERERLALLQRHNSIFESVSEGLTLQLVNDAIIDCNPAAERILGLTRRQLLGLDSFDSRWRSVDDQGEPLAGSDHPAMVASRTNQPVRNFPMGLLRGDGSQVWLSVNAKPIRNGAGLVTHIVASFTDVTAQRAAENERRKTAELLRTAMVASRMVWWEWRVKKGDFYVGSYGPACILGYSNLEMAGYDTGQAWLKKTHPDDRPEVARLLQEALTGRLDRWQCEHRLLAADGTWRWVRNMGRVGERAADGAVLVMLGTTQDVHEERFAEENTRQTAQRLRVALEASKMGVWQHNLKTGQNEWDDRLREIYGLVPGEPVPDRDGFLLRIHPEDRPKQQVAVERLVAGAPTQDYTLRVLTPDRGVRHVRVAGVVQSNAQGRPEWATGINIDVTEEEEKNLALNELTDRLQLALRSSRFGVWEIDLKTKRVQWDATLLSIYGLKRSEFDDSMETFATFVHPDDRERMHCEAQQVMAGETSPNREFRIRRRSDGAERVIEANSYVVRDAAGVPVRLVGMDRDITEHSEAERRRRQLEAQLVQSQKLETLGTLAGGIAHDFNNLLTGMLGFIELTQQTLPLQHEGMEFLQHARSGGLRARELVKRLLLFARRAPDTVRQPMQLETLLVETLPLLTATLPASIVIQSQLTHAVGTVLADSGQIQQVLMNLGVNAAQAISSRQGRIMLGVRLVQIGAGDGIEVPPGTYSCLEVTDTGSGMDAATQARIFDPFFTTKGQGEGTGLGLSIVHGIIHDHGGGIRVRSVPGEGTTFEIFLPVIPEKKPSASVAPSAAPAVVGAGRRVLLVDEEEPVRRFLGVALRRAGFEVDMFADGHSAAKQFAGAPAAYAVAMLDLSMPVRTGIELIPTSFS